MVAQSCSFNDTTTKCNKLVIIIGNKIFLLIGLNFNIFKNLHLFSSVESNLLIVNF